MTKFALLFAIAASLSAQTSKPIVTPATQARSELFTNITIAAGQSVNLDSTLDYSSSETLRVTVKSAASDLFNLLGTAYFIIPNAPEWVTQEVMSGTDFYYAFSGGATFQVCGSQFRLTLRNTGTVPMTLTSIILYTHVY